ncbi:hypothetical protein HYZ98_04930 [Candidatus Peregrinibacteria bacterium]|nr:hypothetical protein [Candidatus Peregrinibacteria bacterium]
MRNRATFSCSWLIFFAFGLAALGMLTHDLLHNPQKDMDLFVQAFEILQSLRNGMFIEYLGKTNQLPLPVFILTVLYGGTIGGMLLTGTLPSVRETEHYLFVDGPRLIHFEGRFLSLFAAIATLILLARSSRILFPKTPSWYAPALLCSSVLFLMHTTAIRPHIFVTFATILSLFFALRRKPIYSLFTAMAALVTLPNGVLSFWFPLWSFRQKYRSLLRPAVCFAMICAVVAAILICYPFFWKSIVRGVAEGEMGALSFRVLYPFKESGLWMLLHVLGDNLVPAICAVIGSVLLWRKRSPYAVPLLLYVGTYMVFLGSFVEFPMSFYLPLIPIFALLGAGGMARFPAPLRVLFFGVIILINLKMALLWFQPNTYQQAKDFLMTQTEGAIATNLFQPFLGIPSTRRSIGTPRIEHERYWLSLDTDPPHARDFVKKEQWEDADVFVSRTGSEPEGLRSSPDFVQCAKFGSVPRVQDGLLWSDDGFREHILSIRLFQVKRLGPIIVIYCRT